MGSCSRRHFLLSVCFLQTISIIERQVFDFLGYMWAPILANFFHIIFVIFGFYGAYLLSAKYVITYLLWNIVWLGWNTFLICFYMDVGILDKNSDILNLGTGSVSWFEVNGYGCKPIYPMNITSEDPYRPVRPEHVDDCLIDYPIVEVIHSGLQCILSSLAIIGAVSVARIFIDEDDRFDFMGGDAKSPQHTSVHPMYVSYSSIPTSASATMLSNNNKQIHNHTINNIDFKRKLTNLNVSTSLTSVNHNNNNHSNNNYNINSNVVKSHRSQSIHKNSSYNNFINRPDIKYTQISTEHLMNNLDDSNENFCLKTFKIDDSMNSYVPFQKPVPTTTTFINVDTNVVHPVRDNSQFFNNYNNQQYNNYNILSNSSSNPFIKQVYQKVDHQPYPDLSPDVDDKYTAPMQYITRSPNINRIASRRRQDKSYVANFCDQIRDTPPGYNDAFIIAKSKSHDRLSNRQNLNKNNPRPRSYCNNSGTEFLSNL